MAQKATIHKAELQISDLDRHYYANHGLTIARHPSENEQRMMVRILAFIRHANEHLAFTKGLSTDDEPDIWQLSLSDDIEVWIELGQADEKRIRKACGRSQDVYLYTYSGNSADIWWQQMQNKVHSMDNLHIYNLPAEQADQLTNLATRSMVIQATIQDEEIWLSSDAGSCTIQLDCWKA
ncbi:MAG: YaeQ family protein [Gammaproteobacteria bacterium]|nr:YaeQ family protein [Gammaproteobacteria bacterium]